MVPGSYVSATFQVPYSVVACTRPHFPRLAQRVRLTIGFEGLPVASSLHKATYVVHGTCGGPCYVGLFPTPFPLHLHVSGSCSQLSFLVSVSAFSSRSGRCPVPASRLDLRCSWSRQLSSTLSSRRLVCRKPCHRRVPPRNSDSTLLRLVLHQPQLRCPAAWPAERRWLRRPRLLSIIDTASFTELSC